jgi:hypothetical protein
MAAIAPCPPSPTPMGKGTCGNTELEPVRVEEGLGVGDGLRGEGYFDLHRMN